MKWSHFIALFISLCFVLFFPSTQPLHCSRVLNDIFKELKRPHDVFILYKEDRKIKSWPQKTIVIQVLILVVTTSGQWRPVKTLHVEVGVKRFDYHYINKKTKKFSRMIVQTVILHLNTSWQERMNSSRVTTPSRFLSIFCREKCKHISATFTNCIVFAFFF